MRIVHVSKVTGIAGSENHLLYLLSGLREAGVDVHLIVLQEPRRPVPDYIQRLNELSIQATAVPIYHHIDPTLPLRLARQFRVLKPDIVHTHLIHADLHGSLGAWLAKVPSVISTRHNDDPFRGLLPMKLQTRALDRIFDEYVAISDFLRQYATRVEKLPPEKITTIHYGQPPTNSPPRDGNSSNRLLVSLDIAMNESLIAVVGRLVKQKGIATLLDAFAHVVDELPKTTLLVVGDGPLRGKLERRARSIGIGDRVRFTGWRNDARDIMSLSNALVVPSLWEGFGIVTLEAMACAKPIIATSVGALPEIVLDGETGWLVPPGDPDALAHALLYTLRHPDEARQRGQRGYQRLADDFSAEKMVGQTLDVYQHILQRKES